MKLLALDQSLNTSGWAIFEDDKLKTYGTFTISPTRPIEERLHNIWKQVNELYALHEFDFLVFENIQQQYGNVETFKKLAYVQATLMLWCYNTAMKFKILGPSEWRKVISDKYKIKFGKARKEQKENCMKFIQEQYEKQCSEDEADAIALGTAAIIQMNKKESAF